MKRLGERVKQSLGLTSAKEFKPTSNARNEAMLRDVRKFAQHIKALHKQILALDSVVQGSLTTMKAVLQSPLPQAYDEQAVGLIPLGNGGSMVLGTNVNTEALVSAGTEMHQQMQHEVLLPLEQWITEYRAVKEHCKKCEELRLDLDTKRRTTLGLQEKYSKHKATNHKETDATLLKVQNEEDKLTRIAQRYAEKEVEVFKGLLRLIEDSAVVRDYAAMALAIHQRCFTAAYRAFDLTTPVAGHIQAPQSALPAGPEPLALTYPGYEPAASMRLSGGPLVPVGQQTSLITSITMTTSSRGVTTSGGGLATMPSNSNGSVPYGQPSPSAPPGVQLPPPAYQHQQHPAAYAGYAHPQGLPPPAYGQVPHGGAPQPQYLPPSYAPQPVPLPTQPSKTSKVGKTGQPSWYAETHATHDDSDNDSNPFVSAPPAPISPGSSGSAEAAPDNPFVRLPEEEEHTAEEAR